MVISTALNTSDSSLIITVPIRTVPRISHLGRCWDCSFKRSHVFARRTRLWTEVNAVRQRHQRWLCPVPVSILKEYSVELCTRMSEYVEPTVAALCAGQEEKTPAAGDSYGSTNSTKESNKYGSDYGSDGKNKTGAAGDYPPTKKDGYGYGSDSKKDGGNYTSDYGDGGYYNDSTSRALRIGLPVGLGILIVLVFTCGVLYNDYLVHTAAVQDQKHGKNQLLSERKLGLDNSNYDVEVQNKIATANMLKNSNSMGSFSNSAMPLSFG